MGDFIKHSTEVKIYWANYVLMDIYNVHCSRKGDQVSLEWFGNALIQFVTAIVFLTGERNEFSGDKELQSIIACKNKRKKERVNLWYNDSILKSSFLLFQNKIWWCEIYLGFWHCNQPTLCGKNFFLWLHIKK